MNQLQQIDYPSAPALPASVNTGSVAIEQQRAIAEVQGKIFIAKSFPRNLAAAHAELMSACQLPDLAAIAFYNVPRSGGSVSGPSIRLAEEIARIYGHMDYGHRELSRDADKSEIEVYAWDMQNNNFSRRQITVMHVLDYNDKKTGQKMSRKLHDQKDIDDRIANIASKQMRGRILALVPKWMVAAAVQQCKNTIAGNSSKPIEARVRDMCTMFAVFGVTVQMLEEYLGHPLASVTVDELVDLHGVYNSISTKELKASEFFGAKEEPEAPASSTISALNQQAAAAANDNRRNTRRQSAAEKQEAQHKPDPVSPTKIPEEPATQAEETLPVTELSPEVPTEDDPFAGL